MEDIPVFSSRFSRPAKYGKGYGRATRIYRRGPRVDRESTTTLERQLGRLEGRLELTEVAESTVREALEREREENQRLREELEAERSKGIWRRLFGG